MDAFTLFDALTPLTALVIYFAVGGMVRKWLVARGYRRE